MVGPILLCYNITIWRCGRNTIVEIEILKGEGKKDGKEEKKLRCVYEIKELAHDLGSIQETGYKILASKDLSKEEENQIVDIIASAKGAMKFVDKLIAEKSDVDTATHKKIDKKADAFLAGLGEDKEE